MHITLCWHWSNVKCIPECIVSTHLLSFSTLWTQLYPRVFMNEWEISVGLLRIARSAQFSFVIIISRVFPCFGDCQGRDEGIKVLLHSIFIRPSDHVHPLHKTLFLFYFFNPVNYIQKTKDITLSCNFSWASCTSLYSQTSMAQTFLWP